MDSKLSLKKCSHISLLKRDISVHFLKTGDSNVDLVSDKLQKPDII